MDGSACVLVSSCTRSGFSIDLNTNEAADDTDRWEGDQVEQERKHVSGLSGICEMECLTHLIKQRDEPR